MTEPDIAGIFVLIPFSVYRFQFTVDYGAYKNKLLQGEGIGTIFPSVAKNTVLLEHG